MKTETKPFDLERALKGEPVVLRNGTKAYIRHYEEELDTSYPLMGCIVGEGKIVFEQWSEGGRLYGDKGESEYDIVGMWVEPLVFEHWSLLSEDIKYLAKDGDGRWFGYRGKPSREADHWFNHSSIDCCPLEALKPSLFPDCDWENSLIERPENV